MKVKFYDTRLNEDGSTRLVEEKYNEYDGEKLDFAKKIVDMAYDLLHLDEFAEEHVYMLALNSDCRLLGIFFISKGSVDQAFACPREIYMRALLIGAAQIIILHNHPSGNVKPSSFDIEMTKQVKEAGDLIGIHFTDHIIIGGNNRTYLSFHESELI